MPLVPQPCPQQVPHGLPARPAYPLPQAIRCVAKERARLRLGAAAGELRGLRGAFEVCASRVRGLALDAETRLLQLGVPMLAVHPELSSPLREGEASHHALYAGLTSLHSVLRAATHPTAWAEQAGGVWDALAASARITMRPQLVLLLSAVLPVEARLSYLGLRHAAYAAPGAPGAALAALLRVLRPPGAVQCPATPVPAAGPLLPRPTAARPTLQACMTWAGW